MRTVPNYWLLAALSVGLFLAASCAKKVAVATPPPAATPAVTEQAAAPTPAPQRPSPPAATTRQQPSRYPDAATRARIEELLARIQDAYFDYDKHALRADAEQTLVSNARELATILKQYPDYRLTVEGHCDERGSAEYNMGLGDARARAAKAYLVTLGIPDPSLETVSFGKERPICAEHDEACWQRNRRAHIVPTAR